MRLRRFNEKYGPWALVAGGSEGIGRQFCLQLARLGLNVITIGRRPGPLEKVRGEVMDETGVQVKTVSCDLSDPRILEILEPHLAGKEIGLLVYNACRSIVGPFLSQPPADHRSVIDTNCRGMLDMVHRFASLFAQRRRGGIILMSSLSALSGTPMVASYAATKAYTLSLGQSLWRELRPSGVDVLTVVAGATLTPNYLATKAGPTAAPEMEPEAVVAQALPRLGRTPVMIPGLANRLAAILIRKFLSFRGATTLVSKSMYRQYGEAGKPK